MTADDNNNDGDGSTPAIPTLLLSSHQQQATTTDTTTTTNANDAAQWRDALVGLHRLLHSLPQSPNARPGRERQARAV